MMRKILFRGKCYDDGEWIFGSLLDDDIIVTKGAVEVDDDYINIVDEWSSVLTKTVGQYTGMKDSTGKWIFEGDIVKIGDDWDKYGWAAGEKGVIYFENGQFKLKTKVPIFVTDYAFKEGAAVLGNIHDNPELLEVQG